MTSVHIGPSVHVKPTAISHAELNGWQMRRTMTGKVWDGYFRTLYGSFQGRIEQSLWQGKPSFYLLDPPEELLGQLRPTRHWPCFVWHGLGRYWIHFAKDPKDIDSGIRTVEGIFESVLERSR